MTGFSDVWKRWGHLRHTNAIVRTTHGTRLGYVRAMDPETGTVILLIKTPLQAHVLMGGAIEDMKADEDSNNGNNVDKLDFPEVPRTSHDSAITAQRLVQLLQDRRVEARVVVEEDQGDGSEVVEVFDGLARVVAPFTEHCVRCDNAAVHARVERLVREVGEQSREESREESGRE